MELKLKGRVAVVTGGGQGIGKGIALRLLQEGMTVVLAEVDEEAGRETAAELEAWGAVRFTPVDVADEKSVATLTAAMLAEFGRIDGLINNAGIANPGNGPIEEMTLANWNRMLAVNLTGPFLCVKQMTPHLRAAQGAIVNIASTRALQAEVDTEAYSAAKGGLTALTRALAVSLGPDVRVNAIAPGWIDVRPWRKRSQRSVVEWSDTDHEQHPVGRIGTPEDIGALTAFLLSPEAGFITGQLFPVDGGMTVKMIYAE